MTEIVALPPTEPLSLHVWGLMKRLGTGDREMIEALIAFHGRKETPAGINVEMVKRAQRILSALVSRLDETQFAASGRFKVERSPYLGVLYIVKR